MSGEADNIVYLGVRHHSPACARLVEQTIAAVKPAFVLIEGPADMNDRLDELLLGHALPIAIFTSYRDETRTHASWSPFCDYSPEWAALTAGRASGAQVKFIDLPAWHPAFALRQNRYADADVWYSTVTDELCRRLGVDNVDSLWDHLVENVPAEGLAERLDTYFTMLRGEHAAAESDTERESYMARWIHAAARQADGRPVVVVCGGFHREALRRSAPTGDEAFPQVPEAVGQASSYLVPYSFQRLDSFHGYQSGMPSPQYYQHVWQHGPAEAATRLLEAVASRLRERRQPVSTADLIAARATAEGLARIRGHAHPARTDLLDGLVSALVSEALDQPLPWTGRGRLPAGTHPVVVEMVRALSGERAGSLHPDTPLPPLMHDVTAMIETHGLTPPTTAELPLSDVAARERSHVLHRLRVLSVPGFTRVHGPDAEHPAEVSETWRLTVEDRMAHVIEASAYGATLQAAATARLVELAAKGDVAVLGAALFDSVLCGLSAIADDLLDGISATIASESDLGTLGQVLATVLGLWRHDRLLGAARSPALGAVIAPAVSRMLWLVEGTHGGPGPAEPKRLAAVVALRDAVRYAAADLGIDQADAVGVMRRVAAAVTAPPDLRGAALGFCWSAGETVAAEAAVRGAALANTMGDWLSGLFAVAREEVLHSENVLEVIDAVFETMTGSEFLIGLPALRQAFGYFPPRERERIAERILRHRGADAAPQELLRLNVSPLLVARGQEIDGYAEALLVQEGLIRRD